MTQYALYVHWYSTNSVWPCCVPNVNDSFVLDQTKQHFLCICLSNEINFVHA